LVPTLHDDAVPTSSVILMLSEMGVKIMNRELEEIGESSQAKGSS